MSQLEIVKNQIHAQDYTCVSSVGSVVNPANLNGTSRLLSIVRTVAGGTPGVPKCRLVQPSGAGAGAVYGLGVFSSESTADTSTYRVTWANQYLTSLNYLQSGSTAGVQFPP
jgi:hypothetical protein